jgi:hypothetical protein
MSRDNLLNLLEARIWETDQLTWTWQIIDIQDRPLGRVTVEDAVGVDLYQAVRAQALRLFGVRAAFNRDGNFSVRRMRASELIAPTSPSNF